MVPVRPPQRRTRPALAPFDSSVAVCPPLAVSIVVSPNPGAAQSFVTGLQISREVMGWPLAAKPPAISIRPSDIRVAVWEDLAVARLLLQAW